jgi:hypothetical protein
MMQINCPNCCKANTKRTMSLDCALTGDRDQVLSDDDVAVILSDSVA